MLRSCTLRSEPSPSCRLIVSPSVSSNSGASVRCIAPLHTSRASRLACNQQFLQERADPIRHLNVSISRDRRAYSNASNPTTTTTNPTRGATPEPKEPSNLFKGPPPKPQSKTRMFFKSLGWVVVLALGGGIPYIALHDNSDLIPPDESNKHFVEVDSGKRKLCYADYGDPEGKVVFAFHGAGGSRMEPRAFVADQLEGLPIRIIAIDRPGYGGSDMKEGKLLDWPEDVIAVADALGIEKFSVLGVSSGGIYAMACAFAIPQNHPGRLANVAIVSGDGPNMLGTEEIGEGSSNRINDFIIWTMRHAPWITTGMFKLTRMFLYSSPDDYVGTIVKTLMKCPADEAAINDLIERKGNLRKTLLPSSFEGLRPGVQGMVQDMKFQKAEPWGFSLSEITHALYGHGRIYVWHGTEDPIVPFGMGKYVASRIPAAVPRFVEKEGHLSLVYNHFKEIATELTKDQPTGKTRNN